MISVFFIKKINDITRVHRKNGIGYVYNNRKKYYLNGDICTEEQYQKYKKNK